VDEVSRFVNVPKGVPPKEPESLARGISILKTGFSWHKEALREVRQKLAPGADKDGVSSEQLASIISILKIYTATLLPD